MASAPHPSPSSLPWVVRFFFLSFYIACSASMGEHNEGPSETQLLRRDVRTSITGMRSGDLAAECLSPSRRESFALLRISPSPSLLGRSVHCLLMRDEFAPSIVVDRRTPFLHTDGRRRYDDRRPACVSGLRHPSHRAAAASAGRRGERRRGERGLARCAEAGDSGRGFCSGGCVSRCAARPAQPCLLITAPA